MRAFCAGGSLDALTLENDLGVSASADSIDRTTTIHRSSSPHSDANGTDARGYHRARDRSRPQYDTGPYDASNGIGNILAVDHGIGWFTACGHERSYQ
jgi:hypothetical protein